MIDFPTALKSPKWSTNSPKLLVEFKFIKSTEQYTKFQTFFRMEKKTNNRVKRKPVKGGIRGIELDGLSVKGSGFEVIPRLKELVALIL